MFNMDHTHYTDEFLDVCLLGYTDIELTAHSFVPLKDEELDETPVPLRRQNEFAIDFGLGSSQELAKDSIR